MTTEGRKQVYKAGSFRNIRVTGSSVPTWKADLYTQTFGLSKREIRAALLQFMKIRDTNSTTKVHRADISNTRFLLITISFPHPPPTNQSSE